MRNKSKGLDLIETVPEELWLEVCDTVQEAVIKTIPMKKKCKKAKWLSEEVLQIDENRREVKGKGENERYTYLNVEFQRIPRRDKNAFLSDQCQEIKENNRMGKTRYHFKKIRYTKGTFYAKMGTIKELKSLLMKVKVESEKVGLKLHIQKTKIMASGPTTSWEIDGETVETVSDFFFLGSKISADGDCSHEIKRRLLLARKVMINLDSIFKSRDITLPTEVRLVKAMVFPVVMYGCESWTVKKAEH